MNEILRLASGLALLTLVACDRLDTFVLDPDAGARAAEDAGEDAGSSGDGGGFDPHFAPVDVLFVVDDSGSMQDEQENLARNFAAFADQVIGVVDYRVAVVTTDVVSSQGEMTGFLRSTYATEPPYTLRGIDTSPCVPAGIGHGCFRGQRGSEVVDSRTMDRATQLATFGANTVVGTCGSGTERAFEALLLALRNTAPGQCNEGFLRPEANLVIIFVSDEEDDSVEPVERYVEALGQFKDYSKIRVAAIGGTLDGEPARCGITSEATCGSSCASEPPVGSHVACSAVAPCEDTHEYCDTPESGAGPWCENEDRRFWGACGWCTYYATPDCCSALASTRYVEFARAVEARVHAARPDFPIKRCLGLGTRVACLVDTICQDSFGDTLARIARELVLSD